ncbi:hypothetical protein A3L12_07445 [Thermococcus sp. P6]|nr:hypothetical protein A3L12_07445 [Thermococcus sp. P6]
MKPSNGILELRFRDGQFIGGRVFYGIKLSMRKELGGKAVEIVEKGKEYDEFVIKDTNVKKSVEKPAYYRA